MKGAILNYGVGNLFSVKKGFEAHSNTRVSIIDMENLNKSFLRSVDFLVFPGVGHFTAASKKLLPMKNLIMEAVDEGLSIFGICLGLQLLGFSSMEGAGRGLGVFKGHSVRFPDGVKIPHMGWNKVEYLRPSKLFEGIDSPYFYFAHSYYLSLDDSRYVLGVTHHGVSFPSVVGKELVVGVQFHPEKSGDSGLRLIKNYLEMIKG